jgi:hypothetical protein
VLRWLESHYGREVDLDGDGHPEGYCYHTDAALRIASTGVIATALATEGDSLRRLYRTPRREILEAPAVARVDYPNVYVRAAEYLAPVLRFAVLKGTPGFRGKTSIVCARIAKKVAISRNGEAFHEYTRSGAEVTLRTDVDREYVFEIAMDG